NTSLPRYFPTRVTERATRPRPRQVHRKPCADSRPSPGTATHAGPRPLPPVRPPERPVLPVKPGKDSGEMDRMEWLPASRWRPGSASGRDAAVNLGSRPSRARLPRPDQDRAAAGFQPAELDGRTRRPHVDLDPVNVL